MIRHGALTKHAASVLTSQAGSPLARDSPETRYLLTSSDGRRMDASRGVGVRFRIRNPNVPNNNNFIYDMGRQERNEIYGARVNGERSRRKCSLST